MGQFGRIPGEPVGPGQTCGETGERGGEEVSMQTGRRLMSLAGKLAGVAASIIEFLTAQDDLGRITDVVRRNLCCLSLYFGNVDYN